MKITFKGDYALKAILDLALHYDSGELVTSFDLSQRIDAPIKFLEQVLLELKKGGFIESRRGNIGGYRLARVPGQITVGDIVRLVDGPSEPIACVNKDYSNCADIKKCIFKGIWQKVDQATSGIIDHITFEDLASQISINQKVLSYSI
ncbi:MAG TPA: Rrf2 family transcriptional regulator [Candidatus Omnitrophota bacterium]|nr:Rrf2 family transcriptional regulator [Candidatus Omnitrophota bacterium]HPD84249.1 Rrf2 family transcriptional regulator [Candidatus Omnitrophota bacterium]HRZ03105.1 Rrf2 family transcriptional regulator [Candidatus Omnitrophota bacterium]